MRMQEQADMVGGKDMGYCYQPVAVVDEETYDAAMWNEHDARIENLMQMVGEVEAEQSYEEEYAQMLKALEGPVLSYYEDTPEEVREIIESINCCLNGNSHKLGEPVTLRVSPKVYHGHEVFDRAEEIVYHEGKLWSQEYLIGLDCWERRCLEAYEKESLDMLLTCIINEIF